MENYNGIKFQVIVVDGGIASDLLQQYLDLDKKLSEFLNPEQNQGNLSVFVPNGFLIKRAGARMTRLQKKDVILVTKIIGDKVYAVGGEPSSESLLHNVIYNQCPNTKLILHFHSNEIMRNVKGEKVEELPYGTSELAVEVGKAALKNNLIILKNHGIVVHAKNEQELFIILKKLFERNDVL